MKWFLSEDNEELIHRVFGGTNIIPNTVRTEANMDFYITKSDNLVVVTETHCIFISTDALTNWSTSFYWDEPLGEQL